MVKIMDTILRDAHQSQAATRMRLDEMLPAADKLDKIGYYALEVWGGATFDACLRYLNEDPWERLRALRKALPNTKLQMLLRGQNLLGYKHYADDVVDLFCKKSIENGIDIIRIFDALNDVRNIKQAVESTKKYGGTAEVALCYTTSPVHNVDYFVDLAKRLEDMGADIICIKDMAGLLKPRAAKELVTALKEELNKKHFPQLYSLKYQRNNKVESFFENPQIDDSEIDLYHISNAYKTVESWIGKYWDFNTKLLETLIRCDIDEDGRDKANNVRFIWYESVNENPIKVFTRLNIGKISLTNAELIKAMMLNRHNFTKKSINDITLRQQEIASEWDAIEYQLQKDEFWLFLNKPGYENPTRIDYIFNLMCENNILHLGEEIYEQIGNDKDRVFRYFYEYFKLRTSDVNACWGKVKRYFNTFKEWYDDIYLYHYIGFLISQGSDAYTLSEKWDSSSTKSSFIDDLKEQIRETVTKIPLCFQYDEDGKDKWKCRSILLFQNIQTVINSNIAQKENDKYKLAVFYKFPFHLYKLEGWDVEHINSNTTNPEGDPATRKEWLTNIYLSLSAENQEKIKEYFTITNEQKKETIYSEIKSLIPSINDWSQEEKNQIWNYTLLDRSEERRVGKECRSRWSPYH